MKVSRLPVGTTDGRSQVAELLSTVPGQEHSGLKQISSLFQSYMAQCTVTIQKERRNTSVVMFGMALGEAVYLHCGVMRTMLIYDVERLCGLIRNASHSVLFIIHGGKLGKATTFYNTVAGRMYS